MSGWNNQTIKLVVLTAETTGFSGLFAYSPTEGAGNLIFSLAAVAGTDPYGNTYPAGISTSAGGSSFRGSDFVLNTAGLFLYSGTPGPGNLIASIAAVAGTDEFGNAYPAGISTSAGGSSFRGSDFILNTAGLFLYSGTPGPGNLIASIAAVAGTDEFGNAYQNGLTSYNGASAWVSIIEDLISFNNSVPPGGSNGSVFAQTAGIVTMYSGTLAATDTTAAFGVVSAEESGNATEYPAGYAITTGPLYAENPSTPGSIVPPEVWHSLPIPSGWTAHGSTAAQSFRYRLMPWHMVCLVIDLTAPSSVSNGATIGTIPSSPAGYLPATDGHCPLATSLNPASGSQGPHVDVDTNGAIKVYGVSGGAVVSCIFFYALD
jgi:hypothetical protein